VQRLQKNSSVSAHERRCHGNRVWLTRVDGAEVVEIASLGAVTSVPKFICDDLRTRLDTDESVASPAGHGSVEIVRIELPAGAEVAYREQRHTFYEQQVVVLDGKLTLRVATDDFELGVDDCIHLQTDVPLLFANRGRSPCRYLVFVNK